jgi:hypothetical protein
MMNVSQRAIIIILILITGDNKCNQQPIALRRVPTPGQNAQQQRARYDGNYRIRVCVSRLNTLGPKLIVFAHAPGGEQCRLK